MLARPSTASLRLLGAPALIALTCAPLGCGSDDAGGRATTAAPTGGEATGDEATGDEATGDEGSETGDPDPSASGDGDGDATGDGDGDGDPSGDGDGDASGDGDGDEACFELDLDMEVVPPNVLLLIDKSSSMTMTWSDGGQATPRWNSLRSVIATLTSSLDDHVRFGAKVYPKLDSGFGECGVDVGLDVAFGLDNGPAILATLPADDAALQGSTPTEAGVEAALAELAAIYAADPGGTPNQAMVLIADGGIGCSGSAATTTAAIAAAHAQAPNSISTYVVGIDISAFVDDEMNGYAVAGGHPLVGPTQFYPATDAEDLATALAEIVSDIQTCEVPLEPAPGGSVIIEVRVDGVLLEELESCEAAPGYVLDEVDGEATLVFCGPSCEAVKASGAANVKYFCIPG